MSLPFCSVNVVYSYAMNPNTASIVNGTSRIEERLHSAEYNLAGWIFDDYLCCVAYLPVVSYESFEMYLFVVFFGAGSLYTHTNGRLSRSQLVLPKIKTNRFYFISSSIKFH